MICRDVRFSRHALQRMFERAISENDILDVLEKGETVEEYANDIPYPSHLLLSRSAGRPLHVVAAQDPDSGFCIVITVYIPDPAQWDETFTRRRV
ncbi:DUF4258 domain-containing protein [Acidithiobacillus sp.]